MQIFKRYIFAGSLPAILLARLSGSDFINEANQYFYLLISAYICIFNLVGTWVIILYTNQFSSLLTIILVQFLCKLLLILSWCYNRAAATGKGVRGICDNMKKSVLKTHC